MSYHHGNLKESLLQAGSEELRVHGLENLSLREIAKRAGVSHNAPYRHFRDKHEFIDKLVERSLRELAEHILAAPLLYPASVFMQAQYIGRLWAQLAIRHPRKAHLLFSGLSTQDEHKGRIQATNTLVRLNVTSILGAARGSELRYDADCKLIATLLIAAFRGIAVMYTSQVESDLIASEDDLLDLCDAAAENILRAFAS